MTVAGPAALVPADEAAAARTVDFASPVEAPFAVVAALAGMVVGPAAAPPRLAVDAVRSPVAASPPPVAVRTSAT